MAEPENSDPPKDEPETEPPKNETEVPAEVSRALKKANKEAETFRLKLKEYEDRDKSEAEKVTDRLKEAEAKASVAEQRYLRASVGADKGLPRPMWDRLQGSTEEEMATDADSLLAVLAPRNGTGSFDAGPKGEASKPDADMSALIRKAAGRA